MTRASVLSGIKRSLIKSKSSSAIISERFNTRQTHPARFIPNLDVETVDKRTNAHFSVKLTFTCATDKTIMRSTGWRQLTTLTTRVPLMPRLLAFFSH